MSTRWTMPVGICVVRLHETINKVGDDIGRRQTFNTAIAAIMELMNALTRHPGDTDQDRALAREAWIAIVLMLNPIVPHICEQLWQALGRHRLLDQQWPLVDERRWSVSS